MQFRIKGKGIYSYSMRRLIYTLCFVLFCWIDQRTKTCSGLDGWLESFRDLAGVGMAVLIMSHYKWSEICKWKIPYIIWSVLCVCGGVFALVWGIQNKYYFNDWLIIVLDVVLYGYIVIHTFISTVLEKKYPKLNKAYGMVWLLMMLLMVISRSSYVWPLCYLVMFGCFYLTDFTKEEQEDLFHGMLDGIIIAFFMMQGLCFVFRPYDEVRYLGFYSNPNLNALFYLVVLAAVFTKIVYATKHSCSKWIKVYYWLGAGTVLSFLLLTIGRTGWITAIVLIGVSLWFLSKLEGARHWWKCFLVLSLSVIITFPVCFGAVRYLPPIFHHPTWFWGEWSEEKVHSWDAWDSEKYIDIDEYLNVSLGRIVDSVADLLEHSPTMMKVQAAENVAVSDKKVPALTEEEGEDAFLVRGTIYKYYLRELNLLGHPYEEQGFQLEEDYWVGHAHNIYLQYGTDFGVPVMLLLGVLVVWGSVILKKRYKKEQSVTAAGYLLYLLIPAVFGLLEYSWGSGSVTILLMFVAWRYIICHDTQERTEISAE